VACIATLSRSDDDAAVSLMTLAFTYDPATRWMYPDLRQYLTHFPTFVRLYASATLDTGTAHAIEENLGIAMCRVDAPPSPRLRCLSLPYQYESQYPWRLWP
jgi:hypothetical protein